MKTIKTGKGLIKLLYSLRSNRRLEKLSGIKRSALNLKQRVIILEKTNGHCHFCGIALDTTNFQADHVKAHCAGGLHELNNYLPACNICNNYRWHYSSEELQIILKLGVWAKSKMHNDPELGLQIANGFMKHEMSLRKIKKVRQEKKKSIN